MPVLFDVGEVLDAEGIVGSCLLVDEVFVADVDG